MEKVNKAVVFDLDGTLMDTIDDLTLSLNEMLSHFGYPTIYRKKTLSAINNGAKKLVERCLPEKLSEEKFNECFAYYISAYASNNCEKTVVFEGMEDLIYKCQKAGYKVCVATNKQASKTYELCKQKLPKVKFDYILGIQDGVIPKPNPIAILSFLESLGVMPQNAYLVGDGDTDVLTAINGNMKGVAVLWGYRDKQALEKVGATVFAQNAKELEQILLSQV